ncbi:MAG: ABC transporter permease [Spirochaetota bacterium]
MQGLSLSSDGTTLYLSGEVTRDTVPELYNEFSTLETARLQTIDCAELGKTDSAGIALIDLIRETPGGQAQLEGAPQRVQRMLSLFAAGEWRTAREAKRPRPLRRGGGRFTALSAYIRVAADSMVWSLLDAFRRGRRPRGSFYTQVVRIGLESVGIIALLSCIVGFIVALQAAAQLRLFGASIYVVDLLGLLIVREVGPLLTAVLVAGRSGSSIASEIATMKVSEELDALRVMGLDPVRYVVVPKVLAITAVMPVLVMISMAVAMAGGMSVSIAYLDLSFLSFAGRLVEMISVYDVVIGFSKTVLFAWQIVVIAVYYGFEAEGGAEGVGLVTTKSVVASIFWIIIIDVFFSIGYLW